MTAITVQGKEYALKQLRKRRKENKEQKKVNNANLFAGEPMYYYCKACDQVIIMPETHRDPPPSLCKECQALKDLGWLK